MKEIIYLDGHLINADEAKINPADSGFLYGAGLFETMRAYSGKIFLLDRHIERLIASARALGINTPVIDSLRNACNTVVEANKLDSARVRLTVTSGKDPVPFQQPTVLVQAKFYTPPADEKYRTGYRCIVAQTKRYSLSPLVRHKTTNYLECLMARTKARSAGYDEALFLNEHDNLTEGSISNLFLVNHDGALVTPPVDAGLLPGITRAFVQELALKLGIKSSEKNISLERLDNFCEAFITNSLMEIMPVASISDNNGEEHHFANRNITGVLSKAYRESIKRQIG